MKKHFGFNSKKPVLFRDSSTSPCGEGGNGVNQQSGYHIRDKDLGKIHRAACEGNVARVQQILLLRKNGPNDKDKRNRTALHLACASGHPAVVTLLVKWKCQLNLCDNENKTALVKAVQCQQEECTSILLEHGADPNLVDVKGYTALHYAVFGQNISIAAKLLSHKANIEARDKDDLTPLLLAVSENEQQMVGFLLRNQANIHAVDKMKRTALILAVNFASSSVVRLLLEQGVDISPQDRYGRNAEDYAVIKGHHMNHHMILEYQREMGPKTPAQDSNLDLTAEESPRQISRETDSTQVHESSEEDSLSSFSSKPHVDDTWPTSDTVTDFDLEEGDKKPGTEPKETRTDVMESIPQEPPNLDHFTSVDGAHRENRSGVLSASGLEEEDIASSLDTECASESLSQKYVDHLSGTSGQRGKNRVNGEVEDVPYIPSCMSGSSNFKRAQQEDPRHGGLAVAHMASPEKYPHSKPTVGVKDAVPNKTVGTKDLQASRSDLPQSSDHKSPFDLPLAYSEEMNAMIQRRNHDTSAVKKTSNQTKPVQDWSKKLWYASNFHAKKRKSIKPKLETWTCPPNSNRTSKIYLKEELQQSMQRCKNKAEKEKKQHRSSVMAVSENNHGSDDDSGLMQQGERGKTNHQWSPTVENGDSDSSSGMHMKEVWKNEREKWSSKGPVIPPIFEKADSLPIDLLHVNDDRSLSERDQDDGRPIKRTPNEENKVKEQINSVDDFDDLTQLPETASKDHSVSVLKKQDSVLSDDSLLEIKKSHYELLTGKIKKMKSKIIGLRTELSEAKEVKSQLEHQILGWQQEFYSLRCTLKQEEEKRRNVYKLYEKTRKELRRRKERYDKEAEMKQQLELTVQALDMELRAVRNNLNQGDESHEKAKELLPKNHMSQNEIAMLKHKIEAVENHNQEMEKKYFMDMKIVKKKYAEVRKTIKLNEETLTKIILERNELTAENTMLKSELENERQNKERLERQVESYRSRLAATHDQVQSQTSKRDLELAFQRGRDKCLPLQDEINLDVSNLKDNEVHSQQLSKSEGKSNGLETELHHGRDALREKSLVFETVPVQRDLSQAQCQKEIEHMPPSEQGKVKKYMDKQESSKGRLSQLESENLLLRQQLDDLQNKKESQQKRVINIQDQFQDTVKSLQAKSEKQYLMLEERNKELTKEYSHLKESINQYENEAMEREVVVEQLQQELADSLKKQSLSEASLELMLRDCAKLEDERQDLKKKVHQMTSKLQEAQELHIEALKCAEETQDHMQKLEIQTAKLKVMNKKQVAKIEQLRRNSLSTSLSEQEKEELQQLMELKQFLESQLDRQKKKNDGLEKEITGLKECLEMARREVNENEKGEPSAHGVVKINPTEMDIQIDTLKHKTQTASQENLAQYLESERSKENTSHESSCKTELEKYKQLYLEELKLRKSLEKKRNKLHRTNRRLAKTCVKRLMEKEQNRSLPQTFTTSPVLEPPGAENIHNSSGFRGNTTTRETLLFSTSRSRPSFDSIVTALMKSQREMEENMNKELAEATAELDSVYRRASRLRSTGDLLKTSHSHMYRF